MRLLRAFVHFSPVLRENIAIDKQEEEAENLPWGHGCREVALPSAGPGAVGRLVILETEIAFCEAARLTEHFSLFLFHALSLSRSLFAMDGISGAEPCAR